MPGSLPFFVLFRFGSCGARNLLRIRKKRVAEIKRAIKKKLNARCGRKKSKEDLTVKATKKAQPGTRRAALSLLFGLLLVGLLLSAFCLAGCGEKIKPDGKIEGVEEYVIRYPEGMDIDSFKAVRAFCTEFREKSGVYIRMKEDTYLKDEGIPTGTKEILIGNTNRPESASVRVGRDDWAIYWENERLVINGGSPDALMSAVRKYLDDYLRDGAYYYPGEKQLHRAEYRYSGLTLAGRDVTEYSIVYERDAYDLGVYLHEAIADACGVLVPLKTEKDDVAAHEIRIGTLSGKRAESEAITEGYGIFGSGDHVLLCGEGYLGAYSATLKLVGLMAGHGGTLALPLDNALSGPLAETIQYSLELPPIGALDDFAELRYETTADNVFARFELARDELPKEVRVLERVVHTDYPIAQKREIYVSPSGNDENPGTKEAPFATLDRALHAMKGKKGGIIWMMGGKYQMSATAFITSLHSGTPGSPLFIKAYEGEKVTLTANREWNKDRFSRAVDQIAVADLVARIPASARDKVLITTLEDQGLDKRSIPSITTSGGPPRLYLGDEEYTLARYPNSGCDITELLYFTMVDDTGRVTVKEGSDLYSQWIERCREAGIDENTPIGWQIRLLSGKVNGAGAQEMADEVLSWVNTGNIWYFGSTFEGWEFAYYNLALDINGKPYWHRGPNGEKLLGTFVPDGNAAEDCTLYDENGNPYQQKGHWALKSVQPNSWGCKHSANSPARRNTFYLFNAIEALDAPGEWFYDEESGYIFLYPTDDFYEDEKSLTSGVGGSYDIIRADTVKNLVIDGIEISSSTQYGIALFSCENVFIQNVSVKNTMHSNLYARECRRLAILYSDFSRCVNGGLVQISSPSSFRTLVPSENVIQNSVFHDTAPTRQTGISFSGCRMVISHNFFSNCTVSGDNAADCILEYNRFDGGSADVVDGGMIYVHGWTTRGNHFRYNLFHRFNATHNAVYNDGQASGNYTYGNMISTLGSKSDLNKGWYSSSGYGNVCWQNIMILRNPAQVAAKGDAVDENTPIPSGSSDQINQSALFYYFWDDAGYSQVGNPVHVATDYAGNTLGGQSWYQSLAGHWWYGRREREVKLYLEECAQKAWRERFPEYMNQVEGIKMIVTAHTETNKCGAKGYEPRYFYVPAQLSGKTYTYTGAPVGTVFTIPAYYYLNNEGAKVFVDQSTKTVTNPEEGVTFTYEEIASMERAWRGPSCCVIRDNIVLGGTPVQKDGKPTGEVSVKSTVTDGAANYYGYIDTADIDNNYYWFFYKEIIPGAEEYEYALSEEGRAAITQEMGERFLRNYEGERGIDAGLCDLFDYWQYDN